MNIGNMCQFALILQTSPSVLESPARKALEKTVQSDFFWLLISTAFVAIGIAFEYPEVRFEFIQWLRSRKKAWVVEVVPVNRNRVPLWSLVGFLIVTAGVAGEGVYEGLLGINDTKIRQMDESSLAADELQISQLQNENLTLQKQAGDAASSAHDAAINAGTAQTLATGARTEADSFKKDIVLAKQQAAKAEADLADALRQATQAQEALQRIKTPRSISNEDGLTASLSAYKGTKYAFLSVSQDPDSTTLILSIDELLQKSGWVRDKSEPGFPGLSFKTNGKEDFSVPVGINQGILISTESTEELDTIRATKIVDLPGYLQAAIALRSGLLSNIVPANNENAGQAINIDKGTSTTVKIAVGSKPLE